MHNKSGHEKTDQRAVLSICPRFGGVVYRGKRICEWDEIILTSLVRYFILQSHFFLFMLTKKDVQLTKDDVPIIYHDFLMSETGIDAPLHSLSLDQVIPEVLSVSWIFRKLTLPVHVYQRGAVEFSRFAVHGGETISGKMRVPTRCWLQTSLIFFERL